MSEEKKLLINNTLNVKGAILDANDMLHIKEYFRRASVQQVVFENALGDIKAETALKIADRAIEIMDDSGHTEEDAIKIAGEQLGILTAFSFAR